MALRLLATALCLILLCACAPILNNTEDLLTPPRLNQRQAKVEEALSATLNLSGILYKYPQRGDNRSPFVFYDLDHNGTQEAIIFYTYSDDVESVRAKVLRETADKSWTLAYDLSGQGNEIDFVQFSNLLDREKECMLIGWKDTRMGTSSLGVYSFDQDGFRTETTMAYQNLDIADYLGNGLNEIALIGMDALDSYSLTMLGGALDGRLTRIGEVSLSSDVSSVLQIRRGRLQDGGYAVYVDERRTDAYVATEVVRATEAGLHKLVGDENYDSYAMTFREIEMLSADLMGDGTLEIPTQIEMPGYFSEIEMPPPPLWRYIRLNAEDAPANEEGGFETAYSAVVNSAAGYLVFFPDRWLEQVTVVRRPESNEWQFYKVDPISDLPTLELLRIRVYSTRDYKDQFTSNYILLAERGIFQYYAYIPKTVSEPLAIAQYELERLFMLI